MRIGWGYDEVRMGIGRRMDGDRIKMRMRIE